MIYQTPKQSTQLQSILQKLRAYLPEIKDQYQIKTMGVFGSYVRGEENDHSDIDVLVEFNQDIEFGLLTFCHLENQLSERLGRRVDLVTKDGLKPHLGEDILKEVVYL